MPTAATRTDVEDVLLGSDLTAYADAVDRLLERAEAVVAADMPGFVFGESSGTVTLEADGDDILVLPNYPVRSVTSVTVDGTELPAADYTVDVLGHLRRRRASLNVHDTGGTYGRWPDRGVVIVVAYDYGYAASATPPEVRGVVAELVAARVVNPSGATQETLGDRNISFAGSGDAGVGMALTAHQRRTLRHWRRNRVASVRVRS